MLPKNLSTPYKPAIISGFNNGLLKKWLVERLEDRARLIEDFSSGKALKEAALAYRPEILIMMRPGADRGLPEAEELALWGVNNGFKVVLVVGEQDLEWELIGKRLRAAGGYVIGWGKGEERSSFYMMNIVMSVIKELAETRELAEAGKSAREAKPVGRIAINRGGATPAPELMTETAEALMAPETQPPPETPLALETPLAPETPATPETLLSAEIPAPPEPPERLLTPDAGDTTGVPAQPVSEKVLLATGHTSVDQAIKLLLPAYRLAFAGACYDRRVIGQMAQALNPGLAVVSPYLKGEGELVGLIRALRENGVRVVVLPGDASAPETRDLVRELIPLGVYDFVFDQVTAPEILARLAQPARLGDISKTLGEPVGVAQAVAEEVLTEQYQVTPATKSGFLERLKSRLKKKREAPVTEELLLGARLSRRSEAETPPQGTPPQDTPPQEPPPAATTSRRGEAPLPPKETWPSRRVKYVTPPSDWLQADFRAPGAIAFVSPWRPGLAGRLSAAAAEMFAAEEKVKIAIIGASGYSTMAGRLGIEEDELIMSDWRIPGSQAPVIRGNLRIWAVDPAKSLHIYNDEETGLLIARAQSDYPRVIIDCADEFNLARELLYQEVRVMYIVPGNDPVEQSTALLWLNNLRASGKTVACGVDLRHTAKPVPKGLKPALVIRDNPEEALWRMLRQTAPPFATTSPKRQGGEG